MLKELFRNRRELGLVAGWASIALAIGLGGYLIYDAWAGDDRPLDAHMMCMTTGCDYARKRPLELGETVPAKCPRCKKPSLVPAFACPQCGTPNIWNEDRGLPSPSRCSKCAMEVQHGY